MSGIGLSNFDVLYTYMIAMVSGAIVAKMKMGVVIATAGGVGYEVRLTPISAAKHSVGKEIVLHTHLKVSDNALDLYGFETVEEREFFELLMTVSGVGPKTALNILSLGSIVEIKGAIGRGDVKYLTTVSGLGKKTAERLVVELKTKIADHMLDVRGQMSDAVAEAIGALEAMGYAREDAKRAVLALDPSEKTTEALLREALRKVK